MAKRTFSPKDPYIGSNVRENVWSSGDPVPENLDEIEIRPDWAPTPGPLSLSKEEAQHEETRRFNQKYGILRSDVGSQYSRMEDAKTSLLY